MSDHEIRVMQAQALAIKILQITAGNQVGVIVMALGMAGGHFAATVPELSLIHI